jgi:hypothetical protein
MDLGPGYNRRSSFFPNLNMRRSHFLMKTQVPPVGRVPGLSTDCRYRRACFCPLRVRWAAIEFNFVLMQSPTIG